MAINYQQGDVKLIPEGVAIPDLRVEEGWVMPKQKEMKLKDKGNVILAEGEVTGHKHQFWPEGGDAKLYEYNSMLYFRSTQGGTLRHEEHKPIQLPPGNFQIVIVREYNHEDEEARQVAD